MNRLQANLCLLCVTLCWSAEIVLFACIPDGVPAFATSAVTALAGAALISFAGWAAEDPRLFAGLPSSRMLVAAWAVYAYFIVAFAQTLNVFAMRRVTAANATIVYSVEILFSIAWGTLLPAGIVDHVTLTPRIALGATLVVAGSLAEIADVGGRRARARARKGGAARSFATGGLAEKEGMR